MFTKPTNNINTDFSLSNFIVSNKLLAKDIEVIQTSIKQLDILKQFQSINLGQVATSFNYNLFVKDSILNITRLHNSINQLDDYINMLSTKYNNLCNFYVQNSLSLKSSFLQNSFNLNSNNILIHYNNFIKNSDQQYITNNKIYRFDPLSNSIFQNKYLCSLQHNYLTLPDKNITNYKITNIAIEYNESSIGNNVVSQSSLDSFLNGYPLFLSFNNITNTQLNNVLLQDEEEYISVIFAINNLQPVNQIVINLTSGINVDAVYYLDHNLNYVLLDYTNRIDSNKIILNFDIKITKRFKIKFKLTTSSGHSVYDDYYVTNYIFALEKITISYREVYSLGYFVSKPISVNNLKGVKLTVNGSSNDFIYNYYLIVNDLLHKKIHYIPILTNYYNDQELSLYLLNNIAQLHFYPSSLVLYKNEIPLELGLDYVFLDSDTSVESTEIPAQSDYLNKNLSIKLKQFDPTSFYHINFRPNNNSYTYKTCKFNFNSLDLNSLNLESAEVSLFISLQQKKYFGGQLPIINSYNLELHHE